MKVITITHEEFADMCSLLASRVADAGMTPDVIIGIKRGGSYVADRLCPYFPCAKRADVEMRRHSTKIKSHKIIRTILRCLPHLLLNVARIIESYCTRYRPLAGRIGEISLPEDVSDLLSYGPRRVLVVDDAIDSGATMVNVVGQLKRLYPHCDISIGVITVTTPHPAIDADFRLYHDSTLIRFPWATDS